MQIQQRSASDSIQSLNHHSDLPVVADQHSPVPQNLLQRLHHLAEATRRTTLLREARDAEMRSLAVLDHSHDLSSEANFFHIQIYTRSSVSQNPHSAV